jgi:diaminopimelate epimerase
MTQPSLFSAAGNRFVVLDGFVHLPAAQNTLASELCARLAADGLLIAAAPRSGGSVRMLLYNRDGSRAEISGNGLRALARWAVERGRVRDDEFVVETDAGPRRVTLLRQAGQIQGARVELGVPRIVEREAALEHPEGELTATLVDLGNPHCIVFVEQAALLDWPVFLRLGPALERHARFPERVNVSFACVTAGGLLVRTWERGVGETASCGTGAAAAAAAALVLGRVRSPVMVQTRGGRLEVTWDGRAPLFLAGPVEELVAG